MSESTAYTLPLDLLTGNARACLRSMLESPEMKEAASKLTIPLGMDSCGKPALADIAKMPHALVAGDNADEVSNFLHSVILSLLCRTTPEEARLMLVDPGANAFSQYEDLSHLFFPVQTELEETAVNLHFLLSEMEIRYRCFLQRSVRNIKEYNSQPKPDSKPMPHIVVIIHELEPLMKSGMMGIEDSICRLAQLGRAAGIHLILGTHRLELQVSTEFRIFGNPYLTSPVLTGLLKSSISTRIAFQVNSPEKSRVILDRQGAKELSGGGDMLFYSPNNGADHPQRIQGCRVSREEIEAVAAYIKASGKNRISPRTDEVEVEEDEFTDPLLKEAIEWVVQKQYASSAMLQRRFDIGFHRARRLLEKMETLGIISEEDSSRNHKLLTPEQE